MEREIEVKILGEDMGLLKEKVKKLGGSFIGQEDQVNINISSSKKFWPEDRGYLRLRKSKKAGDWTYEFTFKEQVNREGARDNLEHTTHVDDPDALLELLRCAGFDQFDEGRKHRESYTYGDFRFDFDQWDEGTYPDPFLEVEAPSKEALYDILEKLDIPKEAISTGSIADLKKERKKEK